MAIKKLNSTVSGSVLAGATSSSTTTEDTYRKFLHSLQQVAASETISQPLSVDLNPPEDFVYTIDTATRTINTPTNIGKVQYDSNSDMIYFKLDRYYGNMDLAQCACVIEFLNAKHTDSTTGETVQDSGIYYVPFYDLTHSEITTASDGSKVETPIMYIPWSIGGLATAYAGEITFTVRFFKISDDGNLFLFNMSMIPKTGNVITGMDITDVESLKVLEELPNAVETISAAIKTAVEAASIYWIEV